MVVECKNFFEREPEKVAEDLVGKLLVRSGKFGVTGGLIRCVDAFKVDADSLTPSRAGMLYEPGSLFLMQYRNHNLFNITTGGTNPSCVQISEIGFHDSKIVGSGKTSKLFGLDNTQDGIPFNDLFYLADIVLDCEVKSKTVPNRSRNYISSFYV